MGSLCTVRPYVVWLTLSAYVFLALGGAAVVLCEGADGHGGLEFAHAEGACEVLGDDAAGGPVTVGSASPACEDTAVEGLLSAERVLPRSSLKGVVLLPAPLLPEWAWAAPEPGLCERAVPNSTPAPPFHLDAVQSVILLI